MESKEKFKYVFKDFDTGVKGHVYMTNLAINISVKEKDINSYLEKGYIIGYCKPYLHLKNNK